VVTRKIEALFSVQMPVLSEAVSCLSSPYLGEANKGQAAEVKSAAHTLSKE
jgi:hypothetical protein